jgi:hypothetical protein
MKTLFFFALMMVSTVVSLAQEVRLNLYSAYVFDDKFSSSYDTYNYYEGKIKGGYQWGVGIEYFVQEEVSAELLYKHQSTTAPTRYQLGLGEPVHDSPLDLNLDYILLGGMRHLKKPDGKVEGFGGLMAGVVFAGLNDPDTKRSASATKFAWGARLGCNIWATEKVGIKLQAEILSAVQSAGGGFYFGTGGAGAGVSTYSTIYQFGLGGGLTFKVR